MIPRISTPEEIAAWLAGEISYESSPSWMWSPRAREVKLLMRRTVIRIAPEAPDYAELCNRLYGEGGLTTPPSWYDRVTDAEAIAHVERAVAQLWDQSGAWAAVRGEEF